MCYCSQGFVETKVGSLMGNSFRKKSSKLKWQFLRCCFDIYCIFENLAKQMQEALLSAALAFTSGRVD